VTLYNSSTCVNGRHDGELCCRGPTGHTKAWAPRAYLQFSELVRCALGLVESANDATHIVRTRPDLMYLDVAHSFGSARLAAITLPTFASKAENGSATTTQLHRVHVPGGGARRSDWIMWPKGYMEAQQPADWFFVVPMARATVFFSELIAPLHAACAANRWSGHLSPSTASAEVFLLAKQQRCNRTSGRCGAPLWFSPFGQPYNNVHFRGVACDPRVPPETFLGLRCMSTFAVVSLSSSHPSGASRPAGDVISIPNCARLVHMAECERRARAVLNASAGQAAEDAARAAVRPFEPTSRRQR